MSFADTDQTIAGAPHTAAPARIQREIGFMVAALKGMLRETGIDGVYREPARRPVAVTQLDGESDLLGALTQHRPADQAVSLLMVRAKHVFGFNTGAYKARRQLLIEVLRENLRSSDSIFELANGCLVLALDKAKLLTGIMVAERIGMALESRRSHKAPINVAIGVSCAHFDANLAQALKQARAAMERAASGSLAPNEVTSLNFVMS
jgi:GGDEF domain-containing protein